MLSNKRHYVYNLFSSYGNTVISSLLSFISVPIALNYWGSEMYGIWTILTSFSTYIMASGLGIDTATNLLMAKNSNLEIKVSILKKGIRMLTFCSLIATVVISAMTIFFPDWFKIIGKMDEANYSVVKVSAIIFIAGIIINLPLSGIANTLGSLGKAYLGNSIYALQNILNFSIILVTVLLKLSFPFYVFFVSVNSIFCNLIKLFAVVYCIKKERKENSCIKNEDVTSADNHYKSILKMGMNLSLHGLALMLIPNISNLIISNNLSVAALVPYSLSYKLFSIIGTFLSNANLSMGPLLGINYGKNNWEWIRLNYKRMFIMTCSLGIFLVAGVIWLSRPFIWLWTGSADNYAGNLISIILGLYFFATFLMNINVVIINSFNYTNKAWLVSWSDGIIFLLTSFLFIKHFGLVSIPLGLFLGAYCVSSWGYPLLIYNRSEKRLLYDFKYLFKNLMVLSFSICIFLVVSKLSVSFLLMTILDFLGMIVTTIAIFVIVPNELKSSVLSEIRRNK